MKIVYLVHHGTENKMSSKVYQMWGALEWKITLCSSLILNCFLASEKSSMRGWGRQMIKVMNASFGLN